MKISQAIRKIHRRAIRLVRKTFFTPLPHTPPFETLLFRLLPSADLCKRAVALSVSVIYFTTQIAFAQPVMAAMPRGALPNLLDGMKLKLFDSGRVVFHALPFGFDYKREDRDRSGYMSPGKVLEEDRKQESRMEAPQALQRQRGLQSPALGMPGSYDPARAAEQFFKNLESMKGIQGEIARIRSQAAKDIASGTESNYIQYNDGKTVFFKNGLTTKILNEKVLDARGNASIRNTTGMEYNEKRLLVSYLVDETDARGNVTTYRRKDIVYSEDSVYYAGEDTQAKQKITSFREDRVDSQGNMATVVRKGMTYDSEGRVTSFEEDSIDTFGNSSHKSWSGASYDGAGNLLSYSETTTDSFGNKTHREWKDATYMKNPKWKGSADKSQSEYLPSGYRQIVTDPTGAVTEEVWSGASYNEFGELVGYTTTRTDFQGLVTVVKVSDTKYDSLGQMTGFDQVTTDSFGNSQVLERRDTLYNQVGDAVSYTETVTDQNGSAVVRERSNMV